MLFSVDPKLRQFALKLWEGSFNSERPKTSQNQGIYRGDRNAEGRTRTGTQVTLRGILSPLRPSKNTVVLYPCCKHATKIVEKR
jgi:hypothetical protein